MKATAAWVSETAQIPDLLRAAPHIRPILDRYGLQGCGGPLGPQESLGFFAKAHDVPIGQLLHEVRDRLEHPEPAPEPTATPADTIYRPFFKAGIAVTLTLGAAWGAYLLLRIAWSGAFTAAGLHEVNAHGHAQIFGWVGLFVMGFAYQAFPRFKHAALACPRLAYASLGVMVGGVLGRSVCEPLADAFSWLGPPAVAAAGLEVVAVGMFAWVVIATWRAAGKTLAVYDYYILCALGWFVAQAVYEAVYLAATLLAADREQLLALVATWQAPLRDVQIHGFALLMILGVSQRLFHHFYGLPEPSRRLSRAALVALNAAVLGEALGLILMRAHSQAWAALWYASVLLLAGAVTLLVCNWRLFSPPEEADRSLKFLRAAYAWLFFSLALLVLLPAYQFGLLRAFALDSHAAQIGFSHAYYGATRHAITVGFISLMIVGVAAKVVPTLNGVDVRRLPALWVPFVLLNTGCALRVTAQTLTDFTSDAFPVAGISGLLELAGLTVWGVHLWRIMAGRRSEGTTADAPASTPLAAGEPIRASNLVGQVIDLYPELLHTFQSFGFRSLANPVLRRTVARYVTLERACRLLDVDVQQFVAALNAARVAPGLARRIALPVLTAGKEK